MRGDVLGGGFAICFHHFSYVVNRQRDFHKSSAIEDEIVGVTGIRMVQVSGNCGGNLGALRFFDGAQEMNALNLVGMLIANFHFRAGVGFQAQKDFCGFSDVVAGNPDGFYVRALRLKQRGKCQQQEGSSPRVHSGQPLGERVA